MPESPITGHISTELIYNIRYLGEVNIPHSSNLNKIQGLT